MHRTCRTVLPRSSSPGAVARRHVGNGVSGASPPPDDTPPCEKKTRAYRYIFFSACACMQNGVLAPLAPLPAKPADSVFVQSALRLPQVRKVPNRRRWEKERVPAARLKKKKKPQVCVLSSNFFNCTLGLARLHVDCFDRVIFMCCYTRRKYISTLVPAPLNKVILFLSNFLAPWCELVKPCR